MTSMDELRSRIASFRQWRSAGRWRRAIVSDHAVAELRRWMDELREGQPDVLAWFVARQLWLAADDYLMRDYNASRCRLRRLENALERWETLGRCPWTHPTQYELAAQQRRWARIHSSGDSDEAEA